MDNAAAELQRRRERARLSQRAFRIRQATTLRDLREENARLKGVIKNVVEVSQSGDPPALRSAIHKAAAAAGLASELCHDSIAPSDITSAAAGLSTGSSWALMSSGVEQQRALLTEQADSVASHHLGPQQSSCMTFRLDCGLLGWPTSLERIVDPPLDIAPYLGPNQHTLAAQIYWYCTETSVSLLYQLAGQQPSRIASVAQHHPVFVAMLRHVSTVCSHNYLLALAEARLEFYRVGYCKADSPAAMRDSALLLRQRVEQEHNVTGQGLEEWFSATKVARIVGETLLSRELRRLEAAIRNDGTDVAARRLLETFIHKFWLQSTCFGDGPRWKESR
ncbi:hypothetical protein DL766_000001 [Monosporascus sp. MC13-8B]|uniref:BZIP domain-containing protein n=1 Tax=Monosporascus cannonballus TaxID=155416 RepID=A0ABY0GQT0_9PEZI|nr:hypothetical protein DL762_010569 [Monosporascus cannonballus]RYP01226.1 hypothetical protein DL763_000351 [Monosporascus cannonballus]RYP40200.1 hypothetical protein DL766_000001 [Monosporascus sp. MC13-8B]